LAHSEVKPNEVDAINGHLTATAKDPLEIENWTKALGRKGEDFPFINTTKSLIGHCLAAAGSIECVASIVQIKEQFIAPNINCEDLHDDIKGMIATAKVPTKSMNHKVEVVAKASFGFGDVNACVLFKRFIP
ncbi:MAG: beta-ketoacyl-[acyl-carrier-protein] synthase family protein, partial [Muricauda sp.]|nr:beta-ketoacyl-[acyl-carrier-protein] synthase family protein [Allomuricauda sp.]